VEIIEKYSSSSKKTIGRAGQGQVCRSMLSNNAPLLTTRVLCLPVLCFFFVRMPARLSFRLVWLHPGSTRVPLLAHVQHGHPVRQFGAGVQDSSRQNHVLLLLFLVDFPCSRFMVLCMVRKTIAFIPLLNGAFVNDSGAIGCGQIVISTQKV
jgi:hypothetical protein